MSGGYDDLVVDIGDVHDVVDGVAEVRRHDASHNVEGHVRARLGLSCRMMCYVAHVRCVIDCRAARIPRT